MQWDATVQNYGITSLVERPLSCEEGLCPMDLKIHLFLDMYGEN
jgi:hypothetical protein